MFVKQYGAPRTGTNVARWLLTEGFPDVDVLMHVLGDKHGPPSDLVRAGALSAGRPALELAREATLQVPARTTDLSDAVQRAELERLAEPLVAALRRREVRFVISIKDPYAWLWRLLRRRGWLAAPADRVALECACLRFCACYRAWLELLDGSPGRGVVIRLERLLDAPEAVVADLATCLGIPARDGLLPPAGIVLPAHWDGSPTRAHFERFDASHHRERRYLDEIGPEARALATRSMDWELLARLGYRPEPG